MVRTYGIAYIGFLSVFLAQLHTEFCVRQFDIIVCHFADVMQQTCTACRLDVQTEFAGHRGTEVRGLASMLQQVLSVRRAVFHLSDETNEFGVQTVYAKVYGGTFTDLDNLFLNLLGHFRHYLFDTRGVNTTVLYQLVQRQTRYLAAYGIERREGDSLRRIVHNDLHARSGFEGTDITSLATDDTTFDFVILNMEDGDGILCGGLGSHALDGLDDDFLCLFVGLQTGIVHDLVDIRHRGSLRFVFEGLDELFLCFLGGHATQLLELFLRFVVKFVHFLLLVVKRLLALLYGLQFLVHFVEAALYITLTLVELLLALLQALLLLLYASVLFTHGIVVL